MKKISLGPLEQEVMNCVWKHDSVTAREVYVCLNKNRKIAYNTIQTIMTRLTSKGLLTRKMAGKTHIYKSKYDKQPSIQAAIQTELSSYLDKFGEDALVAFVDGIDDISDETRDKLIKKLEEK